ncbi:MAG: monofunctional biosynthetic peptidoglycan transglycosylase [Gammaproteobacteria bacterium]|nr:monofunctional biosynthetic peptidoglycan transglycosylase [Gammaproteobacteria bacterium]MDH5215299.1 monofunctional biosynthetic peptidoglycan transglycosylase [Gammaproteobacteria bacterium]
MAGKKKKPGALRRALRISLIVVAAGVALSLSLVIPLRWIDPVTSAFMLRDDSGRQPVLFEWADWQDVGIAPMLAVVAAEDQRFADHFGIDFRSMQEAVRNSRNGERLRGASTISQQLAKNLFLWPGRSYVRKGLEAWFTVLLELCLPKKRILEIYLNVVELGPGIYGVPAASRYFFARNASRISDSDAALLAAVLPNPHSLQVDNPSRYVRERQRWIIGQMQRLRREQWIIKLND